MTNRVLDLSERPARLSVNNGLLVIRFAAPSPPAPLPEGEGVPHGAGQVRAADSAIPETAGAGSERRYRCEELSDPNVHTIPLTDIAVLITSHPQISFTHAVLAGLAAAGGIFIACNEKHMPAAMMLPLETHSTQAERFARQAAVPLPLRKRAWREIVQAKLQAQGRLLEERTGQDCGLRLLASRVRSGDAGNLESHGARIYWRALFGEDDFRRNPEGEGINPLLNYGYAVLRAVVTRAICGAGLHPSLGLHHHNRYDTFCLSDDLMEPFRPLVDRVVAKLADERGPDAPLDKESKRVLLEALLGRFTVEGESRTLFDWLSRAASSLAAVIEGSEEKLKLPLLTPDS